MRSIIVEVESDEIGRLIETVLTKSFSSELAMAMASEFALQVVQKDLPHGFEPHYSVTEVEKLPEQLHHVAPKFYGHPFRAWIF